MLRLKHDTLDQLYPRSAIAGPGPKCMSLHWTISILPWAGVLNLPVNQILVWCIVILLLTGT